MMQVVSVESPITQQCIIPCRLLESTNIKFNDYIILKTSVKKYICHVFITKLPVNCIVVDDFVTLNENSEPSENFRQYESTNIFDDLVLIKPYTFDYIKIKIFFNRETVIHCDKSVYEAVIRKIIGGSVIGKDCVVNSGGLNFAHLLHIHSISICAAFPEIHSYGKLHKTSKIEVIDVRFVEQISQIKDFQNLQLGGINEYVDILKMNLIELPANILVTGPSGCGKSSFVKWFCTNIDCFFETLNGLKVSDLTLQKCQVIKERFSNYLKMFPDRICILFIDHLDALAPYEMKQKSLIFASLLVNIINQLKNLNVSVIATAIQRNSINPNVSSLFVQEINLGIPTLQQRKEIIKCCTNAILCNIDYDKIAQMTPGFVAHDISSLVQEAINIENKNKNNEKIELNMDSFEKALINISPSVLKSSVWNIKVKPIYWKDIGGMFNIKRRLQMCVEWPLHNPEIFKKVDLPCPRGVLLFGPPGCCKTTLARGLATECNANFFVANPAQVYSPYVGESEKNITELFFQARLCAPSIIFLDELDSLVSKRKLDKKFQGVGEKVLSALLNEMDGFGTKVQFQSTLNMKKLLKKDETENLNGHLENQTCDDVIVVAATNRPDLIDDALLRPGRFDVILYIPPPNVEERESVLHTLTKEMPMKNVDIIKIAENTDLFSGADLKNLCNEAAMNALRKDMSASYITDDNFSEALKKIKPSITRQQIEMYEKLSSKYGTVIK